MPQTLEIMRALLHQPPSEIGYVRLCALALRQKAECGSRQAPARVWSGDMERLLVGERMDTLSWVPRSAVA